MALRPVCSPCLAGLGGVVEIAYATCFYLSAVGLFESVVGVVAVGVDEPGLVNGEPDGGPGAVGLAVGFDDAVIGDWPGAVEGAGLVELAYDGRAVDRDVDEFPVGVVESLVLFHRWDMCWYMSRPIRCQFDDAPARTKSGAINSHMPWSSASL
jgi:hypothetical protein